MKKFIDVFMHELGFENLEHFYKSIFGIKRSYFLFFQITASTVAVVVSFVENFVWDPPSGAVVFGLLVLTESLLGTYVATSVKKEKFDYKKFYNIAPKLLAHILLLSLAFNIGKHSILLVWIPNAVFGWFASRNFLTIVLNLIKLNLVKGEFADFLQKKLDVKDQQFIDSTDENTPINEK